MSPGRTAFRIPCIDWSSAGAPAPFRAQTAGRTVSPRKVLALPAGLCWAAACVACASVTVSATRLRTVASCARRRALVCSGPLPPSAGHGAVGSARREVGRGSGCEHVQEVRDKRGVPQVHVDPQEGGTRRARVAVRGGLCVLDASVECLLFCSPARAREWFGPRARGHRGQPTGRPDPGAYVGANGMPTGDPGTRGHTRPPPLGLHARRGHQDVLGNHRGARHLPEGAVSRSGVCSPGGVDWVHRVLQALAALRVELYNAIACPRAADDPLQSPQGNVVTLRTASCGTATRAASRCHTGRHRTGTRGRTTPSLTMMTHGQQRCGSASTSGPMNT